MRQLLAHRQSKEMISSTGENVSKRILLDRCYGTLA